MLVVLIILENFLHMSFFSNWYLNFFSLGALIPVIFLFFAGIFFLSIPKKTMASMWLMGGFFFLSLFTLPYFVATTIYTEYLAYHRFATGFFILFALACFQQFFLYWPGKASKRLIIGFIIYQILYMVLGYTDYAWNIAQSDFIFNFRGMQWDYTDFAASKRFGIYCVFINTIIIVIMGIWRGIQQKKFRKAAFGLAFTFFLASIPAGVINVLSRDGLLSRDFFQIAFATTYVIGFFGFLIIYINIATESVTFMARIITITLATFLLVMTPVSYFSLNALEKAYQENHRKDTSLIIYQNQKPDDLKYISYLTDSKTASLKFKQSPLNGKPQLSLMKRQMLQSLKKSELKESLLAVKEISAQSTIKEIKLQLATANTAQIAYLETLIAIANRKPVQNKQDIINIFATLDTISNKILFTSTRIKHLRAKSFRKNIEKLLGNKADQSNFGVFTGSVIKQIRASKKENQDLKDLTLIMFTDYSDIGTMFNRYNKSNGSTRDHYTAFHILSPDKKGIYEIGFSYLGFRQYIHSVAMNLFIVLVLVTLMILIVFRMFFQGSLITPLNSLIEGVREVNEGDLTVEIPIHVEDEIGFLTRSFNSMVLSIQQAQKKLKDYADQLENKVRDRTAELRNTLETVQELKHQQDGDYFLTALLTRPLGLNQVDSDVINVDFIIKQKKVFTFKNKKGEIGGDLCKAHDITLLGRKYVVFLNADAMGKSMQGAGGALVIGSVFESIINRTQSSHASQKQYPERWLKNVFLELHKVFESFDGSMLISLAMGIIDTQCGLLYYMNAEHPATALYRNKEASFIDEDMMFRKLGTQGLEGKLFIQTIQLENNDVLIAGSDGRDDLLLGENEQGGRLINDDEFLFLDIIKQTDGDIHAMPEAFEKIGDLTDDLSLLRIQYTSKAGQFNGDSDPNHQEDLSHLKQANEYIKSDLKEKAIQELAFIDISSSDPICKETSLAYNQLEDYENAITFGQKYIENNPGDVDMIYRLSLIYKRIRRLEDSADLAERLRLRQPGNIRNLIHLSDIYLNNGNIARAQKIINMAIILEPLNEKVIKVKNSIEAARSK